ncbi:MAG TPA: GWxTD domain-containing protein [Thermoanaerobaculia bacterium]|nr:GWxTD domain-containing protein [Thermoanaerobaculia bacterium]
MKVAFRLAPVLLLASTLPGLGAGLERYKDWSKSPEFTFLATDAEQKEWKKVASDEEADRFVQLFWAKRDPDLKTPVNEFKLAFDQRVKEADQLFSLPRTRGALTERGKLYVLAGPPKNLLRVTGIKPQPLAPPGQIPPPNDPGTSIGESLATFIYEAAQLPEWAGVKSLRAEFVVESASDYVSGSGGGDVRRLETKARQASIRNPSLKEAPHFKTAAEFETERKAAEAAAAEALKGPVLTAPVRAALEGLLAKEDTGLLSLLPIVGRDREPRLQVQLFVPSSAGTPGADSKLAILVRDDAGADAVRFEETTALEATAGGSVTSRAFAVPPGSYGVAVGVFDASSKLLFSAKRKVSVAAAGSDFSLSPLVVAASFSPVAKGKADEAFTLNGNRFVTKGGHLDAEDGLLFVVRVYNPKVDAATKTVRITRTVKIKPKNLPSIDVPQPVDQPVAVPDSKDGTELVSLDVAAEVIQANLGEYLRKPGDYELKVAITDQVAQKTVETSAPFIVTGVLQPKKK